MEHQLLNTRPEGSLSPIPYTGVNKGFLYGWVVTLAIGAFSFGYSIAAFSQDIQTFSCLYFSKQNPIEIKGNTLQKDGLELIVGVAGAIVQIGGTIGSLTAGAFTKYGKKRCIHVANLLAVIGCILIISSGPYGLKEDYPADATGYLPMLLIGRLIYGIGTGCFTVFVNSFISEVSPIELTGPMGIAFQFFVCAGVLVTNLVGMPMLQGFKEDKENKDPYYICRTKPLQFETIEEEIAQGFNSFMRFEYWRIVFAIPIFFSVLQFILMTTVYNYESPKYLKENGMEAELNEVMGKIYSADQVKSRIEAINVAEGGEKTVTLRETLFDPRYSKATLVGVILSAMQQLSGINVIIFYGGTIFSQVIDAGNLIQPLIGLMNFLPVIPAYILIKRYGRKSILTVCSFLMTIAMVGTGVFILLQDSASEENKQTFGYVALAFINIYIVVFELSLGPLTWIYLTEIMTEKGLSIGVAVNLILTVTVALTTPILVKAVHGYVFIGLAGFCLLCAFFCVFMVKETKGLSGKQIAKLYSSVPIDADLLETDPINE